METTTTTNTILHFTHWTCRKKCVCAWESVTLVDDCCFTTMNNGFDLSIRQHQKLYVLCSHTHADLHTESFFGIFLLKTHTNIHTHTQVRLIKKSNSKWKCSRIVWNWQTWKHQIAAHKNVFVAFQHLHRFLSSTESYRWDSWFASFTVKFYFIERLNNSTKMKERKRERDKECVRWNHLH